MKLTLALLLFSVGLHANADAFGDRLKDNLYGGLAPRSVQCAFIYKTTGNDSKTDVFLLPANGGSFTKDLQTSDGLLEVKIMTTNGGIHTNWQLGSNYGFASGTTDYARASLVTPAYQFVLNCPGN